MDRLQRRLMLTTYAGSALVVMSLMFLARDIQSNSFFVHAGAAIAMPSIFLILAALTRRNSHAPLATAGLWTASAWLFLVAILRLDSYRWMLAEPFRTDYWLFASLVAAGVVTLIGTQTRLPLIVPVISLLHVNLAWTITSIVGVPLQWQPLIVTSVAIFWLFLPLRDGFWRRFYEISAGVLLFFLCGFVLWLPNAEPVPIVLTWFACAGLFIVLGFRLNLGAVFHIGAWGFAAAWMLAHHFWVGQPATFGLWMAVPAVIALLYARLTRSGRKRTKADGFLAAMTRWTAADLVIGLTAISLVYTALHLKEVDASTLTLTLLALVALWLGLGIEYRLAVFVHLALYIAPVPLTFLLVSSNVAFSSYPALGIAWQIGGVVALLFGHGLYQQRFAVKAPFFIIGYGLVAVGNLLADSITLPLSLGITTSTALLTATAVIAGWHPTWDALVAWIAPPASRPYAHRALRSAFLLFASWFGAVWFQLVLGATGLSAARQGFGLVLLSSGWFLVGWLLDRKPEVVGWYVHSAGWLLWGIGLLQVFFSPAEAITTAIFGLVVSVEERFRQRRDYWLPVIIMQIAFVVLQLAWLLKLPADGLTAVLGILVVGISLSLPGKDARRARLIAVAGALCVSLALSLSAPYRVPAAGVIGLASVAAILGLKEARWRYAALGFLSGGWLILTHAIGVETEFWQFFPVGVALVLVGLRGYAGSDQIELVGVVMMLCTVALVVRRDLSTGAVVGLGTVISLIGYGVMLKRRKPFIGGALAVSGSALYVAVHLNPWLVPLVAGGFLISVSLLFETRREFSERQLTHLVAIWRGWHG